MEQPNDRVQESNLALVKEGDLSLVDNNALNPAQLSILLKRTPGKFVKTRKAKGGGTWDYVTGGYIKKVLNLMFGWDWDFEVVTFDINLAAKQAIVHGKLTCRTNGRTIIKHQFGRADVKFKKQSTETLDLGNDLKAATTDALKKCASELGIAADIYNKAEFKEMAVSPQLDWTSLGLLYIRVKSNLSDADVISSERILNEQEITSFNKLETLLKGKEQ